MQPAFKQPSSEYSTAEEEEDEEYELEDDEVEEEGMRKKRRRLFFITRSTSLSVGTQGLIENETIPDLLGSDSSHSNLASHADLSVIDSFGTEWLQGLICNRSPLFSVTADSQTRHIYKESHAWKCG